MSQKPLVKKRKTKMSRKSRDEEDGICQSRPIEIEKTATNRVSEKCN